jgi:hypothetical protein
MERWIIGLGAGFGAAVAIAAVACGGTPSGGTGGHASTTTTATGGSTTSSTTSGTTSTTSATGDGGTDGSSPCLDPASFQAAFTIMDPAFCAVAIYTAPELLGAQVPSWGTHHGPLTLTDAADGGVTLERWTPPSGTTGALTKQSTPVAAGVPSGAYLGSQANDLPFFGWTTISWTGPSPSTTGAVLAIAAGAVAATYTANGPYAMVGVSDGSGQGRLLYTGLSALGAPSGNTNGVYAADACSSPMDELGAGTGCSASAVVSAWDEYSGPIAVDKAGDVFAVLTSASTSNQQARGFLAADVARGKGATPGVTLFTLSGFSGGLAAITPTANSPGVLVFQPFDANTYNALDVVAQRFTTSGALAAMGTTSKLLHVPSGTMSGLSFMTDDTDRLWVGYSDTTSTTYVVLAQTQ